jgi:methylamine dehydrogenase heavy chain
VAGIGAWLAGAAGIASAELPVEKIGVSSLPAASPYRLYLTDVAISHLPDGRMLVIDGRKLKVEGMVSTGMFGQTTLSPDRSEIYAITTYYSKLNRGERIEEIDVYDGQTLKLKEEIPYAKRHAQALSYRGTLRTSGDGRFILVQNATPATSVSVVERQSGKLVSEVQTPGCYIVYPAQSSNRFATLCGDGTMLTVSLDHDGNVIGKKKSGKLFDADVDPLFVGAAQAGDDSHFVSFHGKVQTINVAGETAVSGQPWSLLGKADEKKGWRPGGYQPLAVHVASGTLYVGMHPHGKEGSHKDPAKEIWAYDLAGKRRVGRTATPEATGLAVSQGAQPRLFAYDTAKAAITAFDGGRQLKKVASGAGFGDTPTQLEVQ